MISVQEYLTTIYRPDCDAVARSEDRRVDDRESADRSSAGWGLLRL